MNYKLLTALLTASLLSTTAYAEQPTFSAGLSTFAISQNIDNGFSDQDVTFTGIQFIGSVNVADNVQAQLGIYDTEEEDFGRLEMGGFSLKINAGKGFQNRGFKAYGTFGFFNDTLTIKNNSSFEEKVSGLEFGAAIGYNFEIVSLDYGFTIRTSSGYEKDELWGSETDVTTATGYLALSANF